MTTRKKRTSDRIENGPHRGSQFLSVCFADLAFFAALALGPCALHKDSDEAVSLVLCTATEARLQLHEVVDFHAQCLRDAREPTDEVLHV